MSDVRAAAANMHRLSFRSHGTVVGHAQIGALASDDLFFLKPAFICERGVVAPNAPLMSLLRHPPRGAPVDAAEPKPKQKNGAAPRALLTEEFLREHPWASEVLGPNKHSMGGSDASDAGARAPMPASVSSDDQGEIIVDLLEHKRKEITATHLQDFGDADFAAMLPGGAGNTENKAVTNDTVKAEAKTGGAKRFLKDRGISPSGATTFSILTCPEPWAAGMAEYWAAKNQYFNDSCMENQLHFFNGGRAQARPRDRPRGASPALRQARSDQARDGARDD